MAFPNRVYVRGGLSCGVNINDGGSLARGVRIVLVVVLAVVLVRIGGGGSRGEHVTFVALYLPLVSLYSMSYFTASPGTAFARLASHHLICANTFGPSLSVIAA